MRQINTIILHCTATRFDHDVTIDDIRVWHVARGWKREGYHFLIRLDGTIERGRPIDMIGAHAKGFNRNSIGIAYAGGIDDDGCHVNTMNKDQTDAMFVLIDSLAVVFGQLQLIGHNDVTDRKTCPNFDVSEWWSSQRFYEGE